VFNALGQQQWIFAFCERHSMSLLAEPLNLASSLLILSAGAALARRAISLRADHAVPQSVRALIALVAVVGVASTIFHMAPMRWSLLLDVQAINLFVLWFMACFARWMLGLSWSTSLAVIPAFAAYAWLVKTGLPDFGLGIARFMPAVLGLMALTTLLAWRGDPAWRPFSGATAAFLLGSFLNRADGSLCGPLPVGTHFMWHALCGVTLFLITREVLERSVLRAGVRAQAQTAMAPTAVQRLRSRGR
jgi:hypothetical protein